MMADDINWASPPPDDRPITIGRRDYPDTNPLTRPLLDAIATARALQESNAALREALQGAVGVMASQNTTIDRLLERIRRVAKPFRSPA
jgi:hypothetical protein